MDNKKSLIKKILIAIGLFLFILLCASQKQASALVYKGLNQSLIDSPGNTRTGTLTPNQEAVIDFVYTRPNTTTYDLIGFRIHDFSLSPQNYNTPNTESTSCTGYTSSNAPSGYNETIQWSCSGNISNFENLMPSEFDVYVYAFVFYDDNSSNFCYQSSEVKDTFLCPTVGGHSVTKIQFHFRANNVVSWYYRIQTSNNLAYYNFDSTEIINSNQQVVQEQQTTNDILSGSDVSSSSSQGTSFITDSSSSLSSSFDTLTGEGNLVGIVQTFFTQIENSTCEPIVLPIPYTNQNITLPCLGTELQNRVPLLWTLYTTIITGVLVFRFWYYAIDMIKHIFDPYSTGLSGVTDIAGGGK